MVECRLNKNNRYLWKDFGHSRLGFATCAIREWIAIAIEGW